MKTTMLPLLLLFLLSHTLMAQDFVVIKTEKCKTRATAAAIFDMRKKLSHDMVDGRAKINSAKDGEFLSHFIDVTDLNTMKTKTVTVTVDAKTCHIKHIN